MRIVYLEPALGLGGAETLTLTLLTEWLETGHEPHLLLAYRPGTLAQRAADDGVPVESFGLPPGPRIVLGARRVRERIRALAPDAVVINNHDALLPWAWTLGRGVGRQGVNVPVVVVLHSTRVGRITTSDVLHRVFLPRYSRVVPVGNPHADYAHRRFGVPRSHLTTILNGIPGGRPAPLEHSLPSLPPDAVVGVICARLHPDKNHDGLFEATRLLLAEDPCFHLLVAGEGDHRAHLEQRAIDLGIQDNVHFLGVRRDVGAVLERADIGLIASTTETLSVAILEYMQAGLPVVATRVGSLTDQVRDGETGYLVAPDDPHAFFRALREVVESPSLRERFGRAGRQLQEREFTAARMGSAFIELFEELRSGGEPAASALIG